MSNCKPHILQLLKQLHDNANNENLKIVPAKTFFMLLTVKYLGNENGFSTTKPVQSKTPATQKIRSPTTKIELKSFVVSMNSFSKFSDEAFVNMKRLYDLLHDNFKFHWNIELEKLFQQT